MQVSLETTNGLERRLTVGIPAEIIEKQISERLANAAKTVKINGFRKGKVPSSVVKQRFGDGVRQEVIGEAVNRSFYEAISKEGLRPAGAPSIEPKQDEAGKDLEFVATFEVYPEIALADMSATEVTKPAAEVTDADVDNMIDILRKQQAAWEVSETEAAEGNRVNINFVGTKDGEEFEGGKAEGTNLELGSGQMIPGFESGIEGMKAGEEKTIAVTFPADYHSEDLKGAAVEFVITVNAVEVQVLPEVNDEFFAKYGVEEGGVEKFREEVAANMSRELKNSINNKVKTQVMDALIETHSFELPKALVKSEVGQVRKQMMQQFGGGQQIDESLLPDELFTEQAERRVKLGLILGAVITADKIVAEDADVQAKIAELASTYQNPEEVIEYYNSDKEMLANIQSVVMEDNAIEAVIAKANVNEVAMSYDDAIKPEEKEAEEA